MVVGLEVGRVEHLSSYGVMVRPSSLWLGVNTRCPEDSSCCRAWNRWKEGRQVAGDLGLPPLVLGLRHEGLDLGVAASHEVVHHYLDSCTDHDM